MTTQTFLVGCFFLTLLIAALSVLGIESPFYAALLGFLAGTAAVVSALALTQRGGMK